MFSLPDYTHKVLTVEGSRFLIIEDLNLGGTSVTNNIEGVLEDLAKKRVSLEDVDFCIYRDSLEIYDGIHLDDQGRFAGFYSIGLRNGAEACQKLAQGEIADKPDRRVFV